MKWKLLVSASVAVLALAGCDTGSKPATEQPANTNAAPATNAVLQLPREQALNLSPSPDGPAESSRSTAPWSGPEQG